jgi:hypothetical protein
MNFWSNIYEVYEKSYKTWKEFNLEWKIGEKYLQMKRWNYLNSNDLNF